MTRYLISFNDGAMTFPEEELPAVAEATYAVVDEARKAGVWVTGGGIVGHALSIVGTDGSVTDEVYPEGGHLGGFCIVDVPSRERGLEWAAKFAVACRCAQEVWELGADPNV